ncbi:MAG: hypothetical protein HOJ29_02555 [Candidatus Magasanikbacteria bacterium]|nr:hypothetical protein [Candidatus Magasanikbacteria bacterium]
MIKDKLEELGFSKNEGHVYLTLFDLGKARAGEIIDITGLHRNLVYTSLEDLIFRGLVSKTMKKGVAEFSANAPEVLMEEIEKRKQTAADVIEKLKQKQIEAPREVSIHEGIESLKQLRAKAYALDKGETVYILGGSKLSTMPVLSSYWKKWNKKLSEKGVNIKFLFDRSADQEEVQWRNGLDNIEAKYLPSNIRTPMLMAFFGDQLDLSILSDNPLTFSLKSIEVVDGFKTYFKHLWNQKTNTLHGNEGFYAAFGDILLTLKEGEELVVMGIPNFGKDFADILVEFHEKRAKKNIHTRILLNNKAREVGPRLENLDHTQIQWMEPGTVTLAAFLIYGNKTLISLPSKKIFVQINDEDMAQTFRVHFELLWEQHKRRLA